VNSRSMRFHPAMDTQWSLGNSENLCPHSGWGARGVERCQLWPNSGETHCVRTAPRSGFNPSWPQGVPETEGQIGQDGDS
jgi:hypothetical protein